MMTLSYSLSLPTHLGYPQSSSQNPADARHISAALRTALHQDHQSKSVLSQPDGLGVALFADHYHLPDTRHSHLQTLQYQHHRTGLVFLNGISDRVLLDQIGGHPEKMFKKTKVQINQIL